MRCIRPLRHSCWIRFLRSLRLSQFMRSSRLWASGFAITALLVLSGCNPLTPRTIAHTGYRVAPELQAITGPPIERGKPRPIIDSVGWVFGIPGRLLLWDPKIDNHHISHHSEAVLAGYLVDNDLHHVKVRLNQYAPLQDWHRLRANKTVGWGYRYTLGTLSLLGEAILPGRIFGGDHYNPFTATAHIYSDLPSIALHEAAHAKDFSRRDYPGTYALAYLLPVVPLWHESIATRDVLAYTEASGDEHLQREAYRILYPAYGTYVGGALGFAVPRYADPIYFCSVLIGHAAAHHHAYAVPEAVQRTEFLSSRLERANRLPSSDLWFGDDSADSTSLQIGSLGAETLLSDDAEQPDWLPPEWTIDPWAIDANG
jgi:hypothetical protein